MVNERPKLYTQSLRQPSQYDLYLHYTIYMPVPGSLSIPVTNVSYALSSGKKGRPLTAIVVLVHHALHLALLGLVDRLPGQVCTLGAHAPGGVHGLLQRVALPAKDVVGVLAQAGVVAGAEHEGLRAVRWPQRLVVEGRRVPHNLVHKLRDAHRVG
jgi:hypothetical protein